MSIPIVFEPVLVDGARLVDGGLVANVPIARAAPPALSGDRPMTEGLPTL
jgi:predicted acylesterase/phospholipase RssA